MSKGDLVSYLPATRKVKLNKNIHETTKILIKKMSDESEKYILKKYVISFKIYPFLFYFYKFCPK